MTTHIVIPRVLPEDVQVAASAADPDDLARAELRQASTLFPTRPAAIAPSHIVETAASAPEIPDRVRVLDALNVLFVEDLTDEERTAIAETADVFENVEIGVVPPADTPEDENGNWHLDCIQVENARREGLTGNGVRIGVLDTGIDASHPEFAGKHISFMEFDASGFPLTTSPRDAGDHGLGGTLDELLQEDGSKRI